MICSIVMTVNPPLIFRPRSPRSAPRSKNLEVLLSFRTSPLSIPSSSERTPARPSISSSSWRLIVLLLMALMPSRAVRSLALRSPTRASALPSARARTPCRMHASIHHAIMDILVILHGQHGSVRIIASYGSHDPSHSLARLLRARNDRNTTD